ncbi:hypothetical protein DFP72DRAFT_1068677 [Ephemerocybe angulata]|uniref:Chromatin modification-related protein n=1 Tax=Ephemerocybe angulata TaxID=980116 RepID=A0A8H6HXB9_9AGAR|nr:hypothetical protein DFP72DRAFT_1068677 [Tulosesus angulatus]
MPPPRMQQYPAQPAPLPQTIPPGGVEGDEDQLATAYSLLLLSEYTHTLDSLPLDLSRNFADLRELDAVLSSSMQSITKKIGDLTDMIEDGTAPKDQRLWLLNDIAEEAGRLKLGGEDKIRVACQAADNLKTHNGHLRNLTDTLPGFDTSVLIRKTQYPHVSAQSFMPVHTTEHGRRRPQHPSPAKRKRVVNRDDEIDIGSIKSPRKEKVETTGRGRGVNSRAKKVNERAASPAESVLSVNYRQTSQNGRTAGTSSRAGNASASTNKRSRGNASTTSNRNGTPINTDYYDPRFRQRQRCTPAERCWELLPARGRGGDYGAGQAAGAMGYQNAAVNGVGNHQQIMQAYDMHNLHMQNWNTGQPLEGPGMPVSRGAAAATAAASVSANVDMAVNTSAEGQDVDGDADDTRYCTCNGVSFGEMIACDDETCEKEWFHLLCVGLEAPPSGKWYCEECKAKRNAKRTGRGGKRRTGGGRASAKA